MTPECPPRPPLAAGLLPQPEASSDLLRYGFAVFRMSRKSGFLNVSPVDIWHWIILCRGGLACALDSVLVASLVPTDWLSLDLITVPLSR